MEPDSDGSSNMSDGDHLDEEEMEESSDEESSIDADDDDDSVIVGDLNARGYYDMMMERLRQNNCPMLNFWHRRTLALILENVDEFCAAVSGSEGIKSVQLGDIQASDAEGPKLDISDENKSSWNKIFQSFGNIAKLEIGGFNLGPTIMTRLVQAMPNVNTIELYLPWRTVSGGNMQPFVGAILNHSCGDISLCLSNDGNGDRRRNESPSHELPRNHLEDNGILSQLFRLEAVTFLRFNDVRLTLDECKALGNVLVASTCRIKEFRMEERFFFSDDECGSVIANALASNRSIKTLALSVEYQERPFLDSLVLSLPQNTSITRFYLSSSEEEGPLPDNDKFNVADLIRAIARGNATMELLFFYEEWYKLPETDVQELQQDVRQNYSLKLVKIGHHSMPFRAVNILNRIGRNYLQEDSASNSKCIALLAKVKNNLNCLYYHVRENPMLCLTYCSNMSKLSLGSKRKAGHSDSVELGDASEMGE